MNAARKFRAGLIGILMIAAPSGCSSWKTLRAPPAQYLAEKPHAILRVSTPEESKVMLRVVRVSGDSLIGKRWMSTPADWNGTRSSTVALPLTSLSKVEARHINGPKTAVAVALATSVVGLIILAEVWQGTE
jgi:hypothetical protein